MRVRVCRRGEEEMKIMYKKKMKFVSQFEIACEWIDVGIVFGFIDIRWLLFTLKHIKNEMYFNCFISHKLEGEEEHWIKTL